MKKWRGPLVGIAVAALGAGLVTWVASREPTYGGKKVSAWIAELATGDIKSAANVLVAMGKPAVPYLARTIEKSDSRGKAWYQRFYTSPKLPKLVRRLLPAPRTTPNRANVMLLLGRMGTPGVAMLIRFLGSSDPNMRMDSASTLGTAGPAARLAIPALINALQDIGLQREALSALINIGDPDGKGLALLSRLSKANNREIRVYAVVALWLVEGQSKPALGLLTQPDDWGVRRLTIQVLGDSGNPAKVAVPAILDRLQDQNAQVRDQVTNAVRRIDPEAATQWRIDAGQAYRAVPILVRLLQDDRGQFRFDPCLMDLLGEVGGLDPNSAVPFLQRSFQETKNAQYRDCVCNALQRIDPQSSKNLFAPAPAGLPPAEARSQSTGTPYVCPVDVDAAYAEVCNRTSCSSIRYQVCFPSSLQLTLTWKVYTNGIFDAQQSESRVYANNQPSTTNLVYAVMRDHPGRGFTLLSIPGRPIFMLRPDEIGNYGSFQQAGGIFQGQGQTSLSLNTWTTLIEAGWNTSQGLGVTGSDESKPKGRLVVQAFLSPLSGEAIEALKTLPFYEKRSPVTHAEEPAPSTQSAEAPPRQTSINLPASSAGRIGQRWTNSLGMVFTPVPRTKVWFCIWETRAQDYQAFAQATGRYWHPPRPIQGPTHPVVDRSWNDAKAFCAWLSEKERKTGLLADNQDYRLPTDEEWSLAVGLDKEQGNTPQDKDGKVQGQYPWGRQWPPPAGAGNYAQSLGVDNYKDTAPVGSFPCNHFGLFDLGGNAWEWCEDWYDLGQTVRVLRGACCYDDDPKTLLSSCRWHFEPGFTAANFGFRVVLAGTAPP